MDSFVRRLFEQNIFKKFKSKDNENSGKKLYAQQNYLQGWNFPPMD